MKNDDLVLFLMPNVAQILGILADAIVFSPDNVPTSANRHNDRRGRHTIAKQTCHLNRRGCVRHHKPAYYGQDSLLSAQKPRKDNNTSSKQSPAEVPSATDNRNTPITRPVA